MMRMANPQPAFLYDISRRRRFDGPGIRERLFDETVATAMMEGLA